MVSINEDAATADMYLSDLYNNPNNSDLTIVLKDGREIKAHKNILCTANEWFKSACGDTTQFAEASLAVMEFKDDDPDAIERLLYHIYKVPPFPGKEVAWRYWLNVHLTAEKYMEPELSAHARAEFIRVGYSQRKTDDILEVMDAVKAQMGHDRGVLNLAHYLCLDNILALLRDEKFCKRVDEDRDLRWKVIKFFVSEKERKLDPSQAVRVSLLCMQKR